MIQISESAAKQINRLREDDPKLDAESFLRVRVAAGGCSGLSYKLDFEKVKNQDDKVFEQNGTQLVIDPKSFLYVLGMTLDYEGGLNGKGFIFQNPNASRTCGCGSSFGV